MSGFDEIQLLTDPPPEKKNGRGVNYIYTLLLRVFFVLGGLTNTIFPFLSHSFLPSGYVDNMSNLTRPALTKREHKNISNPFHR